MNFKKSISLVLTLCMVFSLFATFVFPVAAEEGSATISFADSANRTAYSETEQVWEQNGITVTNSKGASTNNVGNYTNPGRFYKSSTFTIEYPGMTKLEIDCAGVDTDITNAWVDSFNVDGATATLGDAVVTVVFTEKVDAFTVTMAAQGRANSITVYYAVEEEPAPEDPVVEATNIALGKDYTVSQQFRQGSNWGWDDNADIVYPDDGVKLTDGVTAPASDALGDPAWAGFNASAPEYANAEYGSHKITVDLGAVCDIDEVSMYFGSSLIGNNAGIDYKYAWVSIFVSNDNATWTNIGYCDVGDNVVTDAYAGEVVVTPAEEVSAQYVQFRVTKGGWTFVSEVEVYGTAPVVEEPEEPAVIAPTSLNYYGWTPETEVLLSAMSDSGKTVADALGSKSFQWWTHVVVDWSETEGTFVVSASQTNVTDYETTALGYGRFVLSAWGDNATESAANLRNIAVGDKLYLYGDYDVLVDGTGSISDVTITVGAPSGDNYWVMPSAPAYKEGLTIEYDDTQVGLLGGSDLADFEAGLTDGNLAENATDWANASGVYPFTNLVCTDGTVHPEISFIFNQGEAKNVNTISIMYNAYPSVCIGVAEPDVDVYYSADGIEWTFAETVTTHSTVFAADAIIDADESEDVDTRLANTPVKAVGTLSETVNAQYVKFVLTYPDFPEGYVNADGKVVWEFIGLTEVEITEAGVLVPEDVQSFPAPYGDYSILTDGETAEGLFGSFLGNQKYLVAVMNTNAEANAWDAVIVLDEETTFNTVTIYYWDEANSCIHMPTSVTVTVNGKTYDAVALTTDSVVGEDGIVHAVEYALGEEVTADVLTVTSTMAADQANFFNMMTEVEVSYVAPVTYPDGYIVVNGENGKWQSENATSDLEFAYNWTVDGENLVVNVIVNDEFVSIAETTSSANGTGTNVRLWINYGAEKWDRLYDGFILNDVVSLYSKDSETVGTEGTIALEDKTFTFTLPLAEVSANNAEFQFTVCVSNTASGTNVCLYAPCDTFAWSAWDSANAHTVTWVPLTEVDGGDLPEHNPRLGALNIPAYTKINYTVAFENGANFNLWDENVTVLVNGEALEMGAFGYVAVLEKGDVVTIVNATAEAIDLYPSISAIIPGTYSSPIVLEELGDITANLTADNLEGAVHYLYTAPANGTLTLTMPESGWTYTVNNITTGETGYTQWSDSDPVVNPCVIKVSEGDEIMIIVAPYDEASQMTVLGEVTFTVAFEEAAVTSLVVTDWNLGSWQNGAFGADAANIFTDAEVYASADQKWWFHASFKPTAVAGVYEVVATRGASEAAFLEIPEGGFVWAAHDTAAAGTAGAYVYNIIKDLKVGDRVYFDGVNISAATTEADATATKIVTAADLKLLVSHNYNYNWHAFEGQFITGTIADANGNYLTVAGDAPNMAGQVADSDILYIVENVGGAYLVTGAVSGKDAILETAIPENGFLYYITSNCTNYSAVCHGELVGCYLIIGDIDLNTSFAIDTQQGNPAYVVKAVAGFKVGDVNMNGKIDATDYATIRKLVIGAADPADFSELALELADVNGNGKIDANDYILVKRHFLETYTIPAWAEEE